MSLLCLLSSFKILPGIQIKNTNVTVFSTGGNKNELIAFKFVCV